MKRFMYCGYTESQITLKDNPKVITRSVAYYDNMAFLYFESPEDIAPELVADGDMKSFPDGSKWFRMNEIFHYFSCEDDATWQRKEKDKKPSFFINFLRKDKIASYIYYHYIHQEGNPVNCDRFMSIHNYQDMIIMYCEFPSELVTWADIEGKPHTPTPTDWDDLMDKHFAPWENGAKEWRRLKQSK